MMGSQRASTVSRASAWPGPIRRREPGNDVMSSGTSLCSSSGSPLGNAEIQRTAALAPRSGSRSVRFKVRSRSRSGRLAIVGGALGLVACNGHRSDENGPAVARAPRVDVAADGDDVAEHAVEITGDRDLLDRMGDLSTLDPVAGGAPGIVRGDRIHALPEELRHQETSTHAAQQRRQIVVAMADDQIMVSARVSGGRKPELARRIAAEEVALHHAVAQDVPWTGRHPF